MKYILTILLFFSLKAFSQPVANAGADQTIYLTSTSTATLNGTASTGTGLSYQWREVSTDYNSGATITNANTATTTVSPLPQGVFYLELQVTDNVDRVSVDTMAVIVDYAPAPANSTLLTHAIWSDMAAGANLRDDTTTCYNWTSDIRSLVGTYPNQYYMEKDGELGSRVDTMRQKYYSILNDGHSCSGSYARSEIIPNGAVDLVDSSKIYVIEWKGYFNQDMSGYAASPGQGMGVLMQFHGQDGNTPPFGFGLHGTAINFSESSDGNNGIHNGVQQFDAGGNTKFQIFNTADLTKSCHTLRLTVKEGLDNTHQFIKVEFDGVLKYYRNTGQVGATFMQDWLKGATFYDFDGLVVDPNNHTRGKSASLVTTSYKVYTVTDTVATNTPPTASAGSDQIISLPTNSVTFTGSGTDADGTISSYLWTKEVGGTATITSPTSATTTVTGLSAGEYRFKLTVTDNNGATGSDTVHVRVNNPPTANAGTDQTITLPTNSVSLSGSGTDSDGTIASYSWTKISGGTYTISNSGIANPVLTNLVAGTYVFQLQVTDNNGATGTDTVQITVNAATLTNYFITHGKTIYINK